MQLSTLAGLIKVLFASSGTKNNIPDNHSTVPLPANAAFDTGFPAITMTPVSAGGIPPFGADVNGILFALSNTIQSLQAGAIYGYDSAFSSAIGGYAKGSLLLKATGSGYWVSTADNNTTNPDTGGANWVDFAAFLNALGKYIDPLPTGSANVMTASITLPTFNSAFAGAPIWVRGIGANTITNPMYAGKTIVKGANLALAAGDIAGVGHWLCLQYDSTLDVLVLNNPANGVNVNTVGITGQFKNLKGDSRGINNNTTVWTADAGVLENAVAQTFRTVRNINVSIASTASGANGLDDSSPTTVTITIASPGVVTWNNHGFPANAPIVLATTGALPTGLTAGTTYYVTSPTTNTFRLSATQGGSAINTTGSQSGIQTAKSVLAASSWYSDWIIYNPITSTIAGLRSASATNPTLPSGYTDKARVGWVLTDPTGNKYLMQILQRGRRAVYCPLALSNTTQAPLMDSGTKGSITAPTIAIPVAAFVPPTAECITVIAGQSSNNASCVVAGNNGFGNVNAATQPPLFSIAPSGQSGSNATDDILLESDSIYWAGASGLVNCRGWVDSL